MPSGLLILIIGAAVGAVAGWLILGQLVIGGAVGFTPALTHLPIASWLDSRAEPIG